MVGAHKLGGRAKATQEFVFIDDLDPEGPGLVEFAPGALSRNYGGGLLAHAPGDLAAGTLDSGHRLRPAQRGKRPGDNVDLPRQRSPFARALAERGVELVSTGGTARTLREGGLEVVDVASVTGHPEVFGGRVKTLHPKIHGGILARLPQDAEEMERNAIAPFDLVVVNLYKFEEAAAAGKDLGDLVETIDILPTLLDLCGLPPLEVSDGRSFVPLLSRPNQPWKKAAFHVFNRNKGGPVIGFAARTPRYRLVSWRRGWSAGGEEVATEFYDYEADPAETRNVAENPAYAEALTEVRGLLQTHLDTYQGK